MYIEASSHNFIEFYFGLFSFRFNFDFIGAKYNLLDISYLWSIDDYQNYCYSVDWSSTAMKLSLGVEEFTNECDVGALGFLILRVRECRDRRYTPANNLYDYSIIDSLDKDGSYVAYTCNY
jgi:hypothetical protein